MTPIRTSQPTFSVVMPAFNAAETIWASITSVLGQTRSDFEIIVVDDGSGDDTASIVASFAADERVRLVRQGNRGAAAARNRGVSEAHGRLVSFLDSDDLLMPTYLEAMERALARSPRAGFAYTDAWTLDHRSGRIGVMTAMSRQRPPALPPDDAEEFLLELVRRNFVYTAVTVRRDVLDRVGPFREELSAGIDYEMSLRIAAHGNPGVRAPGLLAVYRRERPGSIQSDPRRVLLGRAEVCRIVAEEYPVSNRVRAAAARRRTAAVDHVAALEGRAGIRAFQRRFLRPALGTLWRRLRRRALWLEQPPDEVAAAFPWLLSGPSGRR